jgi:hypothetical protein
MCRPTRSLPIVLSGNITHTNSIIVAEKKLPFRRNYIAVSSQFNEGARSYLKSVIPAQGKPLREVSSIQTYEKTRLFN